LAIVTPLFGKKRVLFPLPKITKQDVIFISELMKMGDFKPVIDRRYPLEEVASAYKYVETGQKTGNVVITVAHGHGIAPD
jgi:NADPH:quinone reductase-like Zn-dependent oxidoreductase